MEVCVLKNIDRSDGFKMLGDECQWKGTVVAYSRTHSRLLVEYYCESNRIWLYLLSTSIIQINGSLKWVSFSPHIRASSSGGAGCLFIDGDFQFETADGVSFFQLEENEQIVGDWSVVNS